MKKIFCIGLGRTGTTTFQDCMQILGYKHRGWLGPELGVMAKLDFNSICPTIELYDSFDDYPFPLFFRELDECYPESLFVLTKRKSAAAWADSVIRESNRKTFNDSENIWYGGALSKPDRRELLIAKYEKHIESVEQYFSGSENLLTICWEEGEGWEKLCRFLDKPIPGMNLPHRNKGRSLQGRHLIDQLLQQKSYNKVLLALAESQEAELRDYALCALNKIMLEKESVKSSTLQQIKQKIYKNIRLRVLK